MPISVRTFSTVGEAAAALGSDRQARYFGGGTLLMRAVNEGDRSLATLVRTTDARLSAIQAGSARVVIGAGVTMARILAERNLAFLHGPARAVGGPAVRTAATIGGNLFAPSPYGDMAAALLALDATVSVAGSYGSSREMPLDELFAARGRGPVGIVESVSFNRPASGDAFRYRKVTRVRPKGIAVMSIAAHLPAAGGRIGQVRVAYGAMGTRPLRVTAVERALEGRALDATTIAAAARSATEGLTLPTDALASTWYRQEVAGVHLARLLRGEP
jgi:CO/xanthine dehydrogenase FAD-binding subunit